MILYSILKAAFSGIMIAVVSEVAKRNPAMGALIVSLPLVSVISMMWMWRETGDAEKIAAHSSATFWYVLPSMPMFLVLPMLLRSGVHFYMAMALSCVLTAILYLFMVWVLKYFGIHLQ